MGSILQLNHFIVLPILILILVITWRACAIDAGQRGKRPFAVFLLVISYFPLGLAIWLVFQPEILEKNGERVPFHLKDHQVQ